MTTTKTIWVTFARHGIHCYPGAPDEVSYLRAPHRHLFEFRVEISVNHNEREIEYHMFQNYITGLYDGSCLDLDAKSCETIAEDLALHLTNKYPDRTITVEVSEDRECGSIVRVVP